MCFISSAKYSPYRYTVNIHRRMPEGPSLNHWNHQWKTLTHLFLILGALRSARQLNSVRAMTSESSPQELENQDMFRFHENLERLPLSGRHRPRTSHTHVCRGGPQVTPEAYTPSGCEAVGGEALVYPTSVGLKRPVYSKAEVQQPFILLGWDHHCHRGNMDSEEAHGTALGWVLLLVLWSTGSHPGMQRLKTGLLS